MPVPYEEDPADVFDYDADFKIMIGDTAPGGGTHLSGGEQTATLAGLIPYHKIRSAARHFLGYSWADEGSPWHLHREPPAAHPEWPSLRCDSFSYVGHVAKSNEDNEDGEVYIETPFLAPDGVTQLYTAKYEFALATIRYKSYGRTRFLSDADVGDEFDPAQEWKRYCRFNAEPSVQSLSAEGSSQLVFREGAGGLEPTANQTAFGAPIAELMVNTALALEWRLVPHNYVSSQDYALKPDRILRRLGTINDGPVFGYSKGTLLLTALKAEEVLYPVVAEDPYNFPLGGWNLTLVWTHFDPQNKGVPGSEYRGHRLFPWRKQGNWWFATREDSSKELLPLTDHLALFQHVGDPTDP